MRERAAGKQGGGVNKREGGRANKVGGPLKR